MAGNRFSAKGILALSSEGFPVLFFHCLLGELWGNISNWSTSVPAQCVRGEREPCVTHQWGTEHNHHLFQICRGVVVLELKLEQQQVTDYEYPLHSHSAHYQKNDRCPPPPQTLPDRACEVPSCRSDSECERHKRCCYNGCIYACLESVQPPPVLDWLVQPKPRWLGGNGWLLDGPEEVLQAEACSTTEDGDEPLHCPTGYECHIINPGNTAEGIPNRGQCIKLRGNPDGRNLRHKYYKEYFAGPLY
ncbi:WAP four-disulfide core domain protein 1 isoform X4 [Gallus gallus]|uniref:WAP four-disulfide core domain protein 1 isoform X4 n=1 Tax=Gallus gallus TaxID=9031 RepID=UPI001F014522|nr:WAP four-disulfide core domain protein 1 isoform X4 [Gallus gallus]